MTNLQPANPDDKPRIQQLVYQIASEEYAPEKKIYALAEQYLIIKLYDEKLSLDQLLSDSHAHNEFFHEAGEIIASISLLAGTIKTYFEIKKLIRENKKFKADLLQLQWKNDLIDAGLSAEKAEDLSKKYAEDLKSLIT
jgi:hypothetical protein